MSRNSELERGKLTRRQVALGAYIATGSLLVGCTLDGSGEEVGSEGANLTVWNIAELRQVSGAWVGMKVRVLGFADAADDGGGVFVFEPSSSQKMAEVDDVGYVVRAEASHGLWRRFSNSNLVSVKWFGAKGDSVHSDTSAVTAAAAVANRLNGDVFVPTGRYRVDGIGRQLNVNDVRMVTDSAEDTPEFLELVPSSGLTLTYYPSLARS